MDKNIHLTLTAERIALIRLDNGTIAELDRDSGWLISTIEDLNLKIPEDAPLFHFSRLKAKPEGKGYGSMIMTELVKVLDEVKAWVVCFPNPYGRLNREQLIEFYEKFGFTNYTLDGHDGILVRPPTTETRS